MSATIAYMTDPIILIFVAVFYYCSYTNSMRYAIKSKEIRLMQVKHSEEESTGMNFSLTWSEGF